MTDDVFTTLQRELLAIGALDYGPEQPIDDSPCIRCGFRGHAAGAGPMFCPVAAGDDPSWEPCDD